MGAESWSALASSLKLTATAFVIMGGTLDDLDFAGSDERCSSFRTAIADDVFELVPDLEAARLAEQLLEQDREPTGLLDQICTARDIFGDGNDDYEEHENGLPTLGAAAASLEDDYSAV